MISFFKIILFTPLYNLLIWLTSILPGADLGLAIIILTIFVKIVIFPLYSTSVRTQIKMKAVEAEIKEIKENNKDNLPEQSRLTMELYRREKINPFSSFFVLFIQIPIIISLFYVFRESFTIQKDLIYSFVSTPQYLNTNFLGFIELTIGHNIALAFLTGVTQYIQVNLSMPKKDRVLKTTSGPSFGQDLAKSMDVQMRYVMPVITAVIAFTLPAAISLYWVTSNVFSAIYEVMVIKKIKEQDKALRASKV
jgi:YidC/Oxa1 family membrane protein insertase